MAFDWLSGVKDLTGLIATLSSLVKSNRATKDLLIRELTINIMAFQTAQKSKKIDYDRLLELLSNATIKRARENRFTFNTVKKGVIEHTHIIDNRNNRYMGKNCEWLFKNIDEKIEDLLNQKKYHGSLNKIEGTNIPLQFSNLLYKMKLLAEFINA
jgi:hypothetical protein